MRTRFRLFRTRIFLTAWFLSIPASVFSADESPKPIEKVILDRLKSVEMLAAQSAQEVEPALTLYKAEVKSALQEAKLEISLLTINPSIQQCNDGKERWRTCIEAAREVKKILDAAFSRHNLPAAEAELRIRLKQFADNVSASGVFAPVPQIDANQGMLKTLNDQVIKKVYELHEALGRAFGKFAAVSTRASATAIFSPMMKVAERPTSEKVDLISLYTNSFDAAIAELQTPK